MNKPDNPRYIPANLRAQVPLRRLGCGQQVAAASASQTKIVVDLLCLLTFWKEGTQYGVQRGYNNILYQFTSTSLLFDVTWKCCKMFF